MRLMLSCYILTYLAACTFFRKWLACKVRIDFCHGFGCKMFLCGVTYEVCQEFDIATSGAFDRRLYYALWHKAQSLCTVRHLGDDRLVHARVFDNATSPNLHAHSYMLTIL